ncbi:MAG: CRISPR-associated endonuclease Cas2 [Victivallaceae bacterium]|nr:CRISPR-associated endonuclease Cas2 [Victivallaceae bacterium]
MYVIIVYDTERTNCVKLHKLLKKHLFWNQNSVFEGAVTVAQFAKIKQLLEDVRAEKSHITIYSLDSEKFLRREELGESEGNTSNIL